MNIHIHETMSAKELNLLTSQEPEMFIHGCQIINDEPIVIRALNSGTFEHNYATDQYDPTWRCGCG